VQDSLDEKFLNFYRSVNQQKEVSELKKFINYSFLKIYLLVKGREAYAKSEISLIKRVLFSIKELYLAKRRLNKVLKSKSFGCIVVINEPSHLKHAIPLKEDIIKFKPLFVTNKKKYIKSISEGFKTDDIVFIPKIIIRASKFKAVQIQNVISKFRIGIENRDDITQLLNDNYSNYSIIKRFIYKITDVNKIKFVYIFNDLLFTGRVIIDICNKKNIKTYYLMHGLLSDEFIENLHICSNYLVFGDYARNVLIKKEGINNDKVITLGAPYLREQLKAKPTTFFQEKVVQSLPKNRKIALVLLSGPGHTVSIEHHKAILEVLENLIVDKKQEYYFVFKLHGKDNIEYYDNIIGNDDTEELSEVYKFDRFQGRDTIFDWIKIADVVLTGASTTALEAMYMEKPVITIDLKGEFDHETKFIQQGATYHCKTKEKVYKTLDNLLENDFSISLEAKEIVNQYFANFSNIQKFHTEILPQQISA